MGPHQMGKLSRPDLPPGPLDNLMRALHALHARAGRPSVRDLAKGQSFSYATVHDLFTKATTEAPKLPVLLAVVERMAEPDRRSNPEDVVDKFDDLWSAADDEPFDKQAAAVARTVAEVTAEAHVEQPEADAPAGLVLKDYERDVIGLLAQGLSADEIPSALTMTHNAFRVILERLIKKMGVRNTGELLMRARDLGLIDPRESISVGGRAMTKELFFLAEQPEPLHDAAAELRRAGYLVRKQPHDIDGTWHLKAYSAGSELTDEDLTTLDAIAERCNVGFDGWGTYVGPLELDDGPGSRMRIPDLGTIVVTRKSP